MNKKFLLSILAIIPALLMPIAALSQSSTASAPAPVDRSDRVFKYDAYVGYGYTSLNQLNGSRNGLQGVNAAVTRYFGKYFGVTADGAQYRYTYDSTNPGDPTVDAILAGPLAHFELSKNLSGFARVLIGGEHISGEQMTPTVSFAGGYGGGVDYILTQRFSLRIAGDDIRSSFSVSNNNAQKAASSHETRSARATIGVVYKF